MALSTPSTVLRISMILGIFLLCCLVFSIENNVDVDHQNEHEDNLREFQIVQIAKRQEDNSPETSTSDAAPAVPDDTAQVTTKKPKKKNKNKNKNKKTTTTEASSITNATELLSIASASSPGVATTTAVADDPVIDTQVDDIEEQENMTLIIEPKNVYVHEGKLTNSTITYANLKTPLIIKLKVVDNFIYTLASNDTFRLMPPPKGENATKVITIKGKNLGITGLAIIVIEPRKPPPTEPTFIQIIRVMRIPRSIDKIFDYSLLPLVIIATTGMGCKMEWTTIKQQLKRPFPISVGPLCQFILMPFFSFAIAKMVKLDPLTAFGLLTVGSCPGGGLSNMITLLVQADLIQSVVMTFVSTILAVGMLPFNLWVYARAFAPANGGDSDERMGLPLGKILSQIIMLTVPLMIGIVIRHKLPTVAQYILKPLNALSAFLVTSSLGIGIYSNAYVIKSPWETLVSAFLLPIFGFTAGFCIARFIARLKPRSAMTVCIETGVQNNLIAISMLKLSFPQPEADVMARTPIFVAITAVSIGIGMILVGIPINRKANRKKKTAEGTDAEQNSVDDKADVEPPESPDAGYDYKPLPYEKAIAMNGSVNNNQKYTPLKDQDPDAESERLSCQDDKEEPLHEKMRKTFKETDV